MKKRTKVLSLIILSLFLVSILVLMVSAVETTNEVGVVSTTGVNTLSQSFQDIWHTWQGGDISVNVAKVLFFVMISLFIFLIFSGIFTSNGWIIYVISFIVGFLATAYITPADVFSLLNSYTALGLTLTTLVPLIIIGGLTYRAATASKGQVQLMMLQWFAWVLFALYSIYRFVYDWFVAKEGSGLMNGILLITAIVACGVSLANKKITKLLMDQFASALEESEQAMLKEVWATRKAERDAARSGVGLS